MKSHYNGLLRSEIWICKNPCVLLFSSRILTFAHLLALQSQSLSTYNCQGRRLPLVYDGRKGIFGLCQWNCHLCAGTQQCGFDRGSSQTDARMSSRVQFVSHPSASSTGGLVDCQLLRREGILLQFGSRSERSGNQVCP